MQINWSAHLRVFLQVDVLLYRFVPLRLIALVDTVDLASGLDLHVRIGENELSNRLEQVKVQR